MIWPHYLCVIYNGNNFTKRCQHTKPLHQDYLQKDFHTDFFAEIFFSLSLSLSYLDRFDLNLRSENAGSLKENQLENLFRVFVGNFFTTYFLSYVGTYLCTYNQLVCAMWVFFYSKNYYIFCIYTLPNVHSLKTYQ